MTPQRTEQIWIEFSGQLKQFILKRVSDGALADDLLQETFLKIHARIDTLDDEACIRSWLYQITRNTIIDHYRKQQHGAKLPEHLTIPEDTSEQASDEQIYSGLDLREIIEALPEKYRQALILTEYEGLSQKELAIRLDISVSGAKSRVQRARKMLKDDLLKCCHFEFDRYGTIIDYHPITCCCCANSSLL